MKRRNWATPPATARLIWQRMLASLLLAACLALGASAQEPPEIADNVVEAELDRADDENVAGRLRATFAALDELENVEVTVEAGVVRLSGTVDTLRSRALAGELAGKVASVSAVENEIEETRSVVRRLEVASNRLVDRTWNLIDQLPLLIVAFLVFLAALSLSRLIVRFEAPFRLLSENVFLQDLAQQATRLIVVVGGLLVALEIMDATGIVGAILGAAGVVGLAVGFAFRDLVENYVASILLSVRQPFAPMDHVKIDGYEGRVGRLTSRATILVTFEGNHVRIPNGVVFKSTIENFSRKPERRFSFGVAVGVDEDIVAAQELGTGILDAMEGVLDEPAPLCLLEELGDSSVTLQFYGWVDQRAASFAKVRSEAMRLVKQAFDQRGIEMPEPIHRIRLESMDAEPSDASHEAEERNERNRVGSAKVMDISVDRHSEALAAEESASAEGDLLTPDARTE